jgi:UDP-glucose:(heptosyl)LPS alpha-1,3-glucosyltransferase
MRVALLHKRLDLKGGTERDLFRTAQGLRDLGHDVHLFCAEFALQPPGGTTAHCVAVTPLGRTARMLSLAARAPFAARRVSADLVVGFGRFTQQDIIRCGGGSHRGFLRRMRERGTLRRCWQDISVYHRSLLALEKRQFTAGHYKKIIAVSAAVKNDLIENYDVPADSIMVLYNGVDAELFHPAKRDPLGVALRREFKIPDSAPLVLFVGSGFARKGLDRLLALWRTPNAKDAYLLVVGDDASLAQYQSRAQAIARDRIIFAGRRIDVESFYAAADLVALPSVQEAFGNVVLEALAAGVPVLVSGAAGAAEVLEGDLAEGIVESWDSALDVTRKFDDLLARSRDAELRGAARRLAERYSWPEHFQRLDALLQGVAN